MKVVIILLMTMVLAGCQVQTTPPPIQTQDIFTFEECAEAGYPIQEIYPEQCRTPDGRIFTRVTPAVTASPITITGEHICLPKKDNGGAVTLECAFGLKNDQGIYALDSSAIPTKDYPSFMIGDQITVEGTLVPPESVSPDQWTTYDVDGIISVLKVRI